MLGKRFFGILKKMNIKKFGIFLVLFLSVISFSACGKKNDKAASNSSSTSSSSSSSSLPPISTDLPTDKVTDDSKAAAKSELALDVYLSHVIPQVNNIKSQVADTYSDIGVVKDGTHGLRITYQLNKPYTIQDDTAQQIRDSLKSFNGSLLENMGKAGVVDPTLHFVVLNGDGSAVIDEMFTQ